jgi:hypothetical protein
MQLQPLGDGVQLVPEEVAVPVQRQGRGGVPEHLSDALDACPGRDGQACGGMPKLMREKAGESHGVAAGSK